MKIRYIPLNEAAEIIKDRRNNEALQSRLQSLTSGIEPGGAFDRTLDSAPAVYAEYVARPTSADLNFATLACSADMEPWWATYVRDIFTTRNPKKTDMLRPRLVMPNGQDTRSWIVRQNIRSQVGYGIGEYPTRYKNMNVVDYWAELRRVILPKFALAQCIDNVVDISSAYTTWAEKDGSAKKSVGYYPAIMGMYATRAVLFVDYDRFPDFRPIAEAGYEAAAKALGAEPVIVRYAADSGSQATLAGGDRTVDQRQTDLSWLTREQRETFKQSGRITEAI